MVVRAQKISSLDQGIKVFPISGDADLLAMAYLRMKKEGILPRVFYHGVPTLKWFLEAYSRQDGIVYGGFVYPPEGGCEMAGMGWISGLTNLQGIRRAEFGMAFFRRYCNAHTPLAFCRIMLDLAFTDGKLDAIYGHSSVENRGAIRVSRDCGFRQIEIPMAAYWKDHATDEILSVMTKEDFHRLREHL